MILRTAFVIGALVIGSPAVAQSSLGITGATLEVTSTEDEAGQLRNSFATSVDVRITEYHGLQGDLRFDKTLGGTIGHLGGHLYLAPQPGQKNGLFLSLSDVDALKACSAVKRSKDSTEVGRIAGGSDLKRP